MITHYVNTINFEILSFGITAFLWWLTRIVIPRSLQPMILEKLHFGHTGITKWRRLTQDTVWWPGSCNTSLKKWLIVKPVLFTPTPKTEPVHKYTFSRLTLVVISSLLKGQFYFVLQDYFSRFLEVVKAKSTSRQTTIEILRIFFLRLPHSLECENGPPVDGSEFLNFAKEWWFKITTRIHHQIVWPNQQDPQQRKYSWNARDASSECEISELTVCINNVFILIKNTIEYMYKRTTTIMFNTCKAREC